VVVNVLVALAIFVLGAPFTLLADASDRALWALSGQIVATSVTQPFIALFSTFLYYDLRERKRAAFR
jgi:uncharacterized membrane protein